MPSNLCPVEIAGALRQYRNRATLALGHFAQPLRIRRIRRADHDQRVDHRRHLLHRELAVGGGVADVFLVRAGDVRESVLQHRDDLGGVVDRQRRLRHEGEIVRIFRREGFCIFRGLDQHHRAGRQLSERADDFRVMRMPDQEDFAAALEMDRGLAVNFRHQRAGRIQREEIARARIRRDRFGNPVGRKYHRCVGIVGDLGEFLDENRALGLQTVDHIAVMHDLVADIDRGAIDRERPLDGINCPHHAGTEAPGRTKHDFQVWFSWL